MSEAEFHKSVLQYLHYVLPSDVVVQHTMNEGKRGFKAQAWLKASGVVPGWPDIMLLAQGRAYFLELKAPKGYLSPVQKTCHARLLRAGSPVATVRNLDELSNALKEWGIQ